MLQRSPSSRGDGRHRRHRVLPPILILKRRCRQRMSAATSGRASDADGVVRGCMMRRGRRAARRRRWPSARRRNRAMPPSKRHADRPARRPRAGVMAPAASALARRGRRRLARPAGASAHPGRPPAAVLARRVHHSVRRATEAKMNWQPPSRAAVATRVRGRARSPSCFGRARRHRRQEAPVEKAIADRHR